MKRNQVLEVLDKIDDSLLSEAEAAPKKIQKKKIRIAAIAAVLAAVIGITSVFNTTNIKAEAVSLPEKPRISARPDLDDYEDRESYFADVDIWKNENDTRQALKEEAITSLSQFFTKASAEFLISPENKNALWSPVNAYISLAMLAEITDSDTRNEILTLLGNNSIEELRKQTSAVWESVYKDNNNEVSTLANSLWLNEEHNYNQETMDALAYHYYSSVYRCNLGSSKANKSISRWLKKNTGGVLKDSTENINLPPDTVLALYSTLLFQSKWGDEFSSVNNTDDIFHGLAGDTSVTFMNKKLYQTYYYWHDNYSAVGLSLKNGSTMWFILPDEGYTTADILREGVYSQMISSSDTENGQENKKYMKVNLSVPKFDLTSTVNLKDGLMNMGVTKVFDLNNSDFSAITSDTPVYVTSVNQSARVEVDEKGVKAAVYIEIPGAGSAMPPEEIIDFRLDRPFIFVISKADLPLFTGVVNNLNS